MRNTRTPYGVVYTIEVDDMRISSPIYKIPVSAPDSGDGPTTMEVTCIVSNEVDDTFDPTVTTYVGITIQIGPGDLGQRSGGFYQTQRGVGSYRIGAKGSKLLRASLYLPPGLKGISIQYPSIADNGHPVPGTVEIRLYQEGAA